jgi:CRISPR-associated exonuclease Cas4
VFKDIIEKNFRKALQKDTADALGDRSTYIGASDISGCLRKGYLSKTQKVEHSMQQLIVFERGHLVENLARKMLTCPDGEWKLKEQVEIKSTASNGFPLLSHLDFVIYDAKTKHSSAIEVKSSTQMDEPYESYVIQIQLQMALLQKQCGPSWTVGGKILVIDPMSGWYEVFETPPSKALQDLAFQRVETLANAIKSRQCPDGEEQLYCSKCPFKKDCPAITRGIAEQLPKDVQQIVKQIANLSAAEKLIKAQKQQLKDFMEATEKIGVKAGDTTIRYVSVKGKDGVDIPSLRMEMPEVYKKYYKREEGYSYIRII